MSPKTSAASIIIKAGAIALGVVVLGSILAILRSNSDNSNDDRTKIQENQEMTELLESLNVPKTEVISEIKDPAPAASPSESEEKELSESDRRVFYWQLAMAQDKAMEEANRKYRNEQATIDKQIDLQNNLQKKYEDELLKKWGLTREQMKAYLVEGVKNNWPVPPTPKLLPPKINRR